MVLEIFVEFFESLFRLSLAKNPKHWSQDPAKFLRLHELRLLSPLPGRHEFESMHAGKNPGAPESATPGELCGGVLFDKGRECHVIDGTSEPVTGLGWSFGLLWDNGFEVVVMVGWNGSKVQKLCL